MTLEELERRANDCVMEASRTRKPGDTNADVAIEAARLALSGWQPTPKPSPRVMAMREWHLTQYTHPDHHTKITSGAWDQGDEAKAFLAGYAAAVRVAEPLLDTLVNTGLYPALIGDYLTAIGEDTP
ncbi:MAG: hypothetical protein WCO83_02310 [Alphaproteobacteria bacterium]